MGLPISRETRSRSSAVSNGFSRKTFAPASMTLFAGSAPRKTPLIAMIGIERVASAAASVAITLWPSFFGRSRSIRIRSGAAFPTASSAAIPS